MFTYSRFSLCNVAQDHVARQLVDVQLLAHSCARVELQTLSATLRSTASGQATLHVSLIQLPWHLRTSALSISSFQCSSHSRNKPLPHGQHHCGAQHNLNSKQGEYKCGSWFHMCKCAALQWITEVRKLSAKLQHLHEISPCFPLCKKQRLCIRGHFRNELSLPLAQNRAAVVLAMLQLRPRVCQHV